MCPDNHLLHGNTGTEEKGNQSATSVVRGGGVGSAGEGQSYIAVWQSPRNCSPTSQLLLGGQSRMTQRNTRSPFAFTFVSAALIIRCRRHCSSLLRTLAQHCPPTIASPKWPVAMVWIHKEPTPPETPRDYTQRQDVCSPSHPTIFSPPTRHLASSL